MGVGTWAVGGGVPVQSAAWWWQCELVEFGHWEMGGGCPAHAVACVWGLS